jgi:hypothetical protein
MSEVFRLPDGTYDVLVVDAVTDDNDVLAIEITILGGEHKGEVIGIRATGLDIDEVDALGVPGTLTVTDGRPHFVLEP